MTRIAAIEALIQEEVGRNIAAMCAAAAGGLQAVAGVLADAAEVRLGVITGFYVPRGSPPAAETDGPVGVALLLCGLRAAGIPCRVATDPPCAAACTTALAAAMIVPNVGLFVAYSWVDDQSHAFAHILGVPADAHPANIVEAAAK